MSGEKIVSPFSCSHIFSEPLLKGLLRGGAYPLSVHVCTEMRRCSPFGPAAWVGWEGANNAALLQIHSIQSHIDTLPVNVRLLQAHDLRWELVHCGPGSALTTCSLRALSPQQERRNYCHTLRRRGRRACVHTLSREMHAASHYQNKEIKAQRLWTGNGWQSWTTYL